MDQTLIRLWKVYNATQEAIMQMMGRTSNITGEFAEQLVCEHFHGKLLNASTKSADIVLPSGKTIQVKSRTPRQGMTTSLGVIRSWDFNYLVVVLFNTDGSVIAAYITDAATAKSLAVENSHQHGWIITTAETFRNDPNVREIGSLLQETMNASCMTAGKEGSEDLIMVDSSTSSKSSETPALQNVSKSTDGKQLELSLPNKKFALAALSRIKESDLSLLTDEGYCKSNLNHNQAILLEMPTNLTAADLKKITSDHLNRQRYYRETRLIAGHRYAISNDWYRNGKTRKDNRMPFSKWLS